jgi:hypothetical protein
VFSGEGVGLPTHFLLFLRLEVTGSFPVLLPSVFMDLHQTVTFWGDGDLAV